MAAKFRTPSGGVSAAARREAAAKGQAMPGGGFPIRNASDLRNAKREIGRAKNPAAARAFINKRAKALGKPPIGGGKSDKSDNDRIAGRVTARLEARDRR